MLPNFSTAGCLSFPKRSLTTRFFFQECFFEFFYDSLNDFHQAFFDEQCVKTFRKFLRLNPAVGQRFNQKSADGKISGDDKTDDAADDQCLMFEMKRKSLSWALLKHEMIAELNDRNITKETFGPKIVDGESKPFKETADLFMTKIDKLRQKELYPHETCHPACSARGCKWIIAVDGLWKLRHHICMWDNSAAYPSDILDFVPSVCQEAPLHGKAFCGLHCKAAEAQGKPSDLSAFISECGANPDSLTKDGKSKMKDVLKAMSEKATGNETISDDQQVGFLITNKNLATKQNFTATQQVGDDCRKDVGEKTVHLVVTKTKKFSELICLLSNYVAKW